MSPAPYGDPLDAAQWQLVRFAVNHLIVVVAFAVTGALSLVLAHGLIPSLVMTHDAPPDILVFRRILYPIAVVALILAIFTAVRAFLIAIPVMFEMFPRILI
ncbi:MAG TPA: hypothetical protein VG370_30775 [Chloroflexota bacterium]|jgi:hypothetical protein|nr:hypothetical protein [Chloroflexota bacterium]